MPEDLVHYFITHYLPREEIIYRLPVSEKISDIWPAILAERKKQAICLPLNSYDGHAYWYVPTKDILSAGDALAGIARTDELNQGEQYAHDISIADEAYYSSVIEGAYTTRQRARELIRNNEMARDKNERMIVNNYRALQFVLSHLDGPVNEAFVLETGRLLTDGTQEDGFEPGYRKGTVYVMSGRQEIVYRAPDAEYVPGMMRQLLDFINDPEVHPVIKACIAHVYFVTVHPFNDGNGRTARALSYMILLQAGYDFLRQVPVSGLLLQERSRYYKAIRACQMPENGYDLTYFISYYADMLFRTTEGLHTRVAGVRRLKALEAALGDMPSRERLLRGAEWLLTENIPTVTTEKWRAKFRIAFETARQDLNTLAAYGLLTMRISGRKHFYDVTESKYQGGKLL